MNKPVRHQIYVWIGAGIAMIFTACGPMNPKPAETIDPSVKALQHGENKTADFCKHNHFFAVIHPDDQGDDATPEGEFKGHHGTNGARLQILNVDRGTVANVSNNAALEIHFSSGKSKNKGFVLPYHRNADGSFETSFRIDRSGAWKIDINVTDGTLKDECHLSVKI